MIDIQYSMSCCLDPYHSHQSILEIGYSVVQEWALTATISPTAVDGRNPCVTTLAFGQSLRETNQHSWIRNPNKMADRQRPSSIKDSKAPTTQSASGIVRNASNNTAIVPESVRPDGSIRKGSSLLLPIRN